MRGEGAPLPNQMEWPLFFSLPVLMLMIITLLNDGTLCCIGYDGRVGHDSHPGSWPFPKRGEGRGGLGEAYVSGLVRDLLKAKGTPPPGLSRLPGLLALPRRPPATPE